MQELAPELSAAEIEAMYHFTDFPGFLQAFKGSGGASAHAGRLCAGRAADGGEPGAAECTLRRGDLLGRSRAVEEAGCGADFPRHPEAVAGAGVEVRWIVDAIRHFGPEHVMQVAEAAAALADEGVVAFGIGGDEARGSGRMVRRDLPVRASEGSASDGARRRGGRAGSVWKALEIGAERIGHGIRAIEDPVLVRHLADHAIPLEICITSNVMTGVVSGLREHPVRRLYDAGVPITLNTDDPGIFRTTLCAEYELAAREFGFGQNELEEIAANGFRFAFKEKHRVD